MDDVKDNDNVMVGNYALFIDEEPIEIAVEIGGDTKHVTIPLSSKSIDLYIGDFDGEHNISPILNGLRQNSCDTIRVYINSNGGSIAEYLSIKNTIKECYTNIVCYNQASCFSAGAMMFLDGDKRVMYKDSSIMIHDYSVGLMDNGGGITDFVEFENKQYKQIIGEYISMGFITNKEYESIKNGKDLWLNVDDCMKRGIATHILFNNIMIDNDAWKKWKKYRGNKTLLEWVGQNG